MASVGIVGGLGPESTIDYYRRLLEAWQKQHPSSAPSIVIDSLDVQRAIRLVEGDRTRRWSRGPHLGQKYRQVGAAAHSWSRLRRPGVTTR